MKSLSKTILAAALLVPARLFACATCYANGANINDPMVDGMNWAILTLGVVIATVLGTFLAYFIFIMRKSENLAAAEQSKSPATASKFRGRRGGEAQPQLNPELPYGGTPEPAKT